MSEDELFFSDEAAMEIQIKTLMGTCFDIKITQKDTVLDIKKKIYRVEGIPIHQQNLIYRSQELQDMTRLRDAGIQTGSTITLITSMRGGPISTRRLSVACEHQVVLKELRDLLETTRDEIGDKLTPGSKVSVLVFKEGDIINLLRVIENEDGSYSPYSEKPISPPWKEGHASCSSKSKSDTIGGSNANTTYERFVEEDNISLKITNLRRKMHDVSVRKQNRKTGIGGGECTSTTLETFGPSVAAAAVATNDETTTEKNISFKFLSDYAAAAESLKIFENVESSSEEGSQEIALKDKHRSSRFSETKQNLKKSEVQTLFQTSRNHLHLTRLVLNGGAESQELEENGWEHTTTSTQASNSTTACKVGVLKERRQSLCYDEPKNFDFPNCYHQSAIPPQYAPKEHYYNVRRSPLYGRKKSDGGGSNGSNSNGGGANSNNGSNNSGNEETSENRLYGYYNLGCNNNDNDLLVTSRSSTSAAVVETTTTAAAAAATSSSSSSSTGQQQVLAPVLEKKRMRCSECNRRLNITNMYDCRCGLIFCAQHRYSEAHRCSYDYKSAGRRVLEQQNPLVQAEKVNKI